MCSVAHLGVTRHDIERTSDELFRAVHTAMQAVPNDLKATANRVENPVASVVDTCLYAVHDPFRSGKECLLTNKT